VTLIDEAVSAFEFHELKQKVSLETKCLGKKGNQIRQKKTLRLQEMGQKVAPNDTAFTTQKQSIGISA
jgi:hypothetical protein